jgi:serine/threonine protein kinase
VVKHAIKVGARSALHTHLQHAHLTHLQVLLCDFGHATPLGVASGKLLTCAIGKDGQRAPEVDAGHGYDHGVDMYTGAALAWRGVKGKQ